jgi:hypothetical protein
MAHLVFSPKHIEVWQPPPTPPFLHSPQLRSPSQPEVAWQPLPFRQLPPCLFGTRTVSRFRPFLRRRDSTSRPQRSAIRARNP